jgi:hypothetical protein
LIPIPKKRVTKKKKKKLYLGWENIEKNEWVRKKLGRW